MSDVSVFHWGSIDVRRSLYIVAAEIRIRIEKYVICYYLAKLET